MFKKLILILSVVTIVYSQSTGQNTQTAYQLTQSCYITTGGDVIVNASGHYTTAVSEQVALRDSMHGSNYDTVGNVFNNNKRIVYTYDAGGLLTESAGKTVDKSGLTWTNSQQIKYKYTGFQLLEETYKNWDKTLSDWSNFTQNKYSYETGNSLSSIFYLPWDSDSLKFEYSTKDLVAYDGNKKAISVSNQKYNKNLGSWDNYLRVNFAYSGGYISEKVFQVWNKSTQLWEDYQKEIFSYSNNQKSEVVMQVKSASTSWENYSRNVFVYTNSTLDNIIESLWYGSWTNNRRYVYTFNANNLETNAIVQQWVAHLGSFRNQTQDESYYSQHQVFGIQEMSANTFLVANPLSKQSTFLISALKENTKYQLQLVSLNGSVVLNIPVVAGQEIRLNSQLQNGLYMLSVTSPGTSTLHQKIVLAD